MHYSKIWDDVNFTPEFEVLNLIIKVNFSLQNTEQFQCLLCNYNNKIYTLSTVYT